MLYSNNEEYFSLLIFIDMWNWKLLQHSIGNDWCIYDMPKNKNLKIKIKPILDRNIMNKQLKPFETSKSKYFLKMNF